MKKILLIVVVCAVLVYAFSFRTTPEKVAYGISFSVFHSNELKLDWKKVYDGLLNDIGVKRFRLSAHWPLTEPKKDVFNWSELDYQISQAETHDATVILAVGRRLPGWPECHEPDWAKDLSKEEKRKEVLEYITATVNRYKGSKAISYWQVENEPFLTLFAKHICQDFLDKDFLKQEIELIRSLDTSHRPILVTDSGELGLWYNAYSVGDAFGTSLYVYVWNHYVGPIRYPITPGFFKLKRNIVEFFYGKKDTKLIELSLEPWLLQPIIDTPIETSLKQMNIERFNKVIDFAQKAGFEEQYLWGGEWWFYMKKNGHPEFWERAGKVFKNSN